MEPKDTKVGDVLLIMITGMTGKYEGIVVEMDSSGYPVIKVEEDGPFSRLKMGDYVILRDREKH